MFHSAIARHAREKPDAAAFVSLERSVGYGRLQADLDRVTRRVAALGIAPQSLVGVWVREPYLMWLTLLALTRLRQVSFSFFSDSFDEVSRAIVKPGVILTDRPEQAGDPRFTVIDASWMEGPDAPFEDPPASADDPIRLNLSSGTTGTAKKVLWTRRMAEGRVADLLDHGLPPQARTLTMFMPQTGIGFTVPLATFAQGGTVLGCESLVWSADLWALAPNLIALTPRQLQDLVVRLPVDHRIDPGLRVVTAGSLTPRPLRRAVQARVTPDLNIWYGAGEAGMIAHCSPAVLDRYETAVGTVLSTAQVQVLGDNDEVLAPGEMGHIRVKTTVMADGYLHNPELTKAAFRDGWFHPGDTGFLSEDGVLVLEGRASEVLNFGGTKLSPDLVERTALAVAGVLDAAAFTLPGPQGVPFLTVAVQPDEGFSAKAVSAALEAKFPVRPIRVVQLRRIPRNAGGKIQRNLLRPLVQGPEKKKRGGPPRKR